MPSDRLPDLGPDAAFGHLAMRPHRRAALRLGLGAAAALIGAPAPALAPALAQTPARKLRVVTTFTVIQDMAANIAGEAATVESITRPGAEIHDYQPTPLDVVKAQQADLVLWNGMNLEQWFERFFAGMRSVQSAVVTESIVPIGIKDGPYEGKPNPHAWMSTASALTYVANIEKAMAKADPANAATYAANAKAYADRIRAMDAPLRARLATVPEATRWLVSSEGAFSYLTREYGWREAYLWPINADQQGTPQQVRRLIDLVRQNRIPVVFSESTISDRPIRQVARETGARYGGVLHVDSLSAADGPVPTYLKLLEATVETMAKGFGA
jgi:manganese/iron transport system substrate-binding protein